MRILGIESSCDECSASVVQLKPDHSVEVKSLATFSQIQLHQPFGGVVPEVASRNHLETVNSMVDQALAEANLDASQIDGIAVTNRPGLVGALLVGVSAAKALAYAFEKPLVAVHHLEGHAVSAFLDQPAQATPTPLLLAIVSGGHTNLYRVEERPEKWPLHFLKTSLIGRSRDDAAGEAFDKTAKILGFPYPGGVWIDQFSKGGDPLRYAFPRALPQKDTFDFSFSGLKTAVALQVNQLKKELQDSTGTDGPEALQPLLPDLCASIQAAIVDALLIKIKRAIREYNCRSLVVVGGVAANHYLRQQLQDQWESWGLESAPFYPKLTYCTDNAAMIAAAGAFRLAQGHALDRQSMLTLNAIANPES